MIADKLITSLKKTPNTKDSMEAFLSELEDVDGWITVNKLYKKHIPTNRIKEILETDKEYVTLLDKFLRKKYELLDTIKMDLDEYDFLMNAYLTRSSTYEDWELRHKFERAYSTYISSNKWLDGVLQPFYKEVEERYEYLINNERDSFINMSLPKGTIEISLAYRSKRTNVLFTPEVKKFIDDFVDEPGLTVLAYRVVKKPSILTRIGKRLGLCT